MNFCSPFSTYVRSKPVILLQHIPIVERCLQLSHPTLFFLTIQTITVTVMGTVRRISQRILDTVQFRPVCAAGSKFGPSWSGFGCYLVAPDDSESKVKKIIKCRGSIPHQLEFSPGQSCFESVWFAFEVST